MILRICNIILSVGTLLLSVPTLHAQEELDAMEAEQVQMTSDRDLHCAIQKLFECKAVNNTE